MLSIGALLLMRPAGAGALPRCGNIFLAGDEVAVALPKPAVGKALHWRAFDVDGNAVATGNGTADGRLTLGKLPVGWYRVDFRRGASPAGWTTAAVIAGPPEAVPASSPVCVDSAISWLSKDDDLKQRCLPRLAKLAGANWIRDRIEWEAVAPGPGRFVKSPKIRRSLKAQSDAGLRVLEVFHSTPRWAVEHELDPAQGRRRFPRDLRHVYRFCREMGMRFKGLVQAWEPWNEADSPPYGGHTIDEMCSYQKAAWLGFKAADSKLTVCWNVFAGGATDTHAEGIRRNRAWRYFDTMNVHSYIAPGGYFQQFAAARRAAHGRPLWLTECGIRLNPAKDGRWGDLTREDQRRQAAFLARSIANSLFAGIDRHFFFILDNYLERGKQYGFLRHDLTPRPAYVALAALGRFLAGAKPLGKLWAGTEGAQAFAFHAMPDGKARDVVVAWSAEEKTVPVPSNMQIQGVYDLYGRALKDTDRISLGPSPRFFLLPAGGAGQLKLTPPPGSAVHREGTPAAVVLQAEFPQESTRLGADAHRVPATDSVRIPLHIYNFDEAPVSGRVVVAAKPAGCSVAVKDAQCSIKSMETHTASLILNVSRECKQCFLGSWITIRGDFGSAGKAVVAFRIIVDPLEMRPVRRRPVASADRSNAWTDNIVHDGRVTHRELDQGGVVFDMQFGQGDPWCYPELSLGSRDLPEPTDDGLALKVRIERGAGILRVQFIEKNGSVYVTDLEISSAVRESQKALAIFRNAEWAPWSPPDPDGMLRPEDIRSLRIGINSSRGSRVRLVFRDLAWVDVTPGRAGPDSRR